MSRSHPPRCAPRAESAYLAARSALAAQPHDLWRQRALGDLRANLAAARFVDGVNQLGADDALPAALMPRCTCAQAAAIPRRWAQAVARTQRPYWQSLADQHGLHLDAYLAQVDQRLRRVVAGCRLYVRVPMETLPLIAATGRLGTCSDAGAWGGGALGIRQQTGAAVFGLCPLHAPAAARHIYAYLARPTQFWRIAHAPWHRRHFGLDRFGLVDLELAPSTHRRATVTWGALADVTDCGFRPGCRPRPLEPQEAGETIDHLAFPVHVADRGFGWQGWMTRYRTSDPLAKGQLSPLRHVLQAQVAGPVPLSEIAQATAALPDGACVSDDPDLAAAVAQFNAVLSNAKREVRHGAA